MRLNLLRIWITFIIVCAVLASFVLITQTQQSKNETGVEENKNCISDTDCTKAGCSSQLCLPANVANETFTTCEWKEEYGCLQKTSCKCIQSTCGWENTSQYSNCLSDITK